jgi:ubiquinone/menaquinone biosynthesis C-methylase UbiE
MSSEEFWGRYATDATLHYNGEMAKFIKDLAVSLRVQSVLEVGCSAGNDLKLFPKEIDVNGVDNNEHAIKRAQQDLPDFGFKVASTIALPYEDASMDFVFTRNTLNHIHNEDVKKSFEELFRVSKKYILNIEAFSENENLISQNPTMTGRNARRHWSYFKVKVISDVDMHKEIDPKQSRFTLVRKI